MTLDAELGYEIAGIGDLQRAELAARWANIYGCPPPSGVRRELLSHAVAWDIQARHLGGLSPQTRKALKLAVARVAARLQSKNRADDAALNEVGGDGARDAPLHKSPTPARSLPRPGARLIREWNGKANVVDVIQGGYLFEGKSYRSLSAIARQITNAHWSGPRFFGL